jgi:hypothetical protein
MIAVPVFVTDVMEASTPPGRFAPHRRAIREPLGGVNDAVVTAAADAVEASAGVEASTSTMRHPSRVRR